MPETDRLYDAIVSWWEQTEDRIATGATTAKVEAANTGIKNIKRTGRGSRNVKNYQARNATAQCRTDTQHRMAFTGRTE